MAFSLMQTPHIKNKMAPVFNSQMFNGSYINAVANAPHKVTKVAIHFIVVIITSQPIP